MCYICEARGNVGPKYAETQKIIASAVRVVGKPSPKPSWGNSHDWTKAPPANRRLWSNADLKEYGKEWRREHLTS